MNQEQPKQPKLTTDKPINILASRTFRDIIYKLDPLKQNPTYSPITKRTHILDCYDHTLKILQCLEIDSQRITPSSKAIQTTLERLNKIFRTSNHI